MDKDYKEDTKTHIGFLSGEWKRIVIETDEKNPITIAVIDDELIEADKGYRVRLLPKD